MGSTRSFHFTSEQLRLIHSFDEEGGMWIRCLPCYNYALTTKKGNNLAKDPSLVKLRSPFSLSYWNGSHGHCTNQYHINCVIKFDEPDEKKRKQQPISKVAAPSILTHFTKLSKRPKITTVNSTSKAQHVSPTRIYCNGLFPITMSKSPGGSQLQNALRLKAKYFNMEASEKFVVNKIKKTGIFSLFSKRCIPCATPGEVNGPRNYYDNKTANGFRCAHCHDGNRGISNLLSSRKKSLIKTEKM